MKESKSTWQRVRKLFNDIHLWLGIAAGIILFVVCLTGTIYTFRTEIEETIASDKFFVDVPDTGERLSTDQLIEIVINEFPGQEVSSITVPDNKSRSYRFYVRKEGERRGKNYLVNPYNGEVLGDTSTSSSAFFSTVFRLHRWLALDTKIGRPIVGWATVIFVFLCITGIVIWVPQKVKAWKQGLKIKWSGNWKRINHDLHNALGFYSVFFLLIMGLTGLQWSFDWYRTGLYDVLGVDRSRQAQEEKAPISYEGMTALTIDESLTKAESILNEGNYSISMPKADATSISITKANVGFFASSGRDRITLNRYTGEIEKQDIFADKPLNEQIGSSIKALHMGYVFGTFSKIIYFITCLIATSLPVTGTIIWVNKLKKKRAKKRKSTHKQRLVDQPGKLATA